ncbi:hypothetical protein BURMUCGD2M_1149 [Burkholderia multivorans CGD2M]|nr:hypothetical protein BURMUCGD2M_1149 [Burkholderia multivorans CGD2M]
MRQRERRRCEVDRCAGAIRRPAVRDVARDDASAITSRPGRIPRVRRPAPRAPRSRPSPQSPAIAHVISETLAVPHSADWSCPGFCI